MASISNRRVLLLLLSSATTASFSAVDNTCLIQAARSSLKTQIFRSRTHHDGNSKAWKMKHTKLERSMNESHDSLQKFIGDQDASSDACSARLLEAKRTLDGLLHDVRTLSEEVLSHETLLSTESENLKMTHLAIESAEQSYEHEKGACKNEQDEARQDLSQYQAELRELVQIAQPNTRYEATAQVISALPPSTSLIKMNESTWTHERCLLFVDFARRNMQDPNGTVNERSCDLQRKELQAAFDLAYVTVTDLLGKAKERVEDKSCFEEAEAKHTSEIVPLVGQREQASSRIEASTQALASMKPVLSFVQNRAEKLQAHIDLALKPECSQAAEVSKALNDVRNLIISLEECPGRNDFKLQIPSSGTSTLGTDVCPADNSFCPKGLFPCASGPGVGGCFTEPDSKKFPGCHSFATKLCSESSSISYDHLCPVDNENCPMGYFACKSGPGVNGCFPTPDRLKYPGCHEFATKEC